MALSYTACKKNLLKTNTAILTLSSLKRLFLGNEDKKDQYYCAPSKQFLPSDLVCNSQQNCQDYGDEIDCQGMGKLLRIIINLLCSPRFW